MNQSTFSLLLSASSQARSLDVAYDSALRTLFAKPLWKCGSVTGFRVLWTDARRARTEDRATFNAKGLYLWGCESRPLYIGKTTNSFGKRFSRYIWDKRSQCNLARDYERDLQARGIHGFPPEIHQWYATYTTSKIRLEGAARFAQEGLRHVWFVLLPHDVSDEISMLESAVVAAAVRWNAREALSALLNVDFVPGAAKRRRKT